MDNSIVRLQKFHLVLTFLAFSALNIWTLIKLNSSLFIAIEVVILVAVLVFWSNIKVIIAKEEITYETVFNKKKFNISEISFIKIRGPRSDIMGPLIDSKYNIFSFIELTLKDGSRKNIGGIWTAFPRTNLLDVINKHQELQKKYRKY